ncbi:RbsD/FucU family protein [Pseudoroseomonas globiformis]|uniref:RbsD/FucU family protein n=1 Tax=Teichococcus globiformis TaxID=2307229 RepID=A0ABV7FVS2_9PROT
MLKGIHPFLTPDLLRSMAEMGHGDTLVLADANFPAAALAASSAGTRPVLRLAGLAADAVLEAVLTLLPIDDFIEAPIRCMAVVDAAPDAPPPEAVAAFTAILASRGLPAPAPLDRFAFYAEAARAFAIVQTGERRLYGNLILTKGVIRP